MKSFFNSADVQLDDLAKWCRQTVCVGDYPSAVGITENVVVYERDGLVSASPTAIKSELAHCLKDGPGVFVVRGAFDDHDVLNRCNDVFAQIVAAQNAGTNPQGDHFGSNQRIWNSMQKTCVADPDLFVRYYGNEVLRITSQAWLGPSYQLTGQMNTIRPGGAAQSAHRDYHLGFQSTGTIANFPVHAQIMSQFLTLQGAIAHCDMPIESGPTMLLPFSQLYPLGYLGAQHPGVLEYFDQHHVQMPLARGDALFFNPALFHAGGKNTSNADRIANLIQVSSAFGRTMETINHRIMIEAVYPVLLRLAAGDSASQQLVDNAIAAAADGYSFPTNLDSDPPIDGKAPETQQQLLRRALDQSWSLEALCRQLDEYQNRRQA